jgi:hypothetical protein
MKIKMASLFEAAAKPYKSPRSTTALDDAEATELDELVNQHGLVNVARAVDCSVQSVAKGIAKKPLYESTKRRLRSVLRKRPA